MAQEEIQKPAAPTTAPVPAEEIPTGKEIVHTESFKEEGYLASELPEAEKNALAEFKEMVREALNKRELTAPPEEEKTEENKQDFKTEETSAAPPPALETKKEENSAAPAPAAPPAALETKNEEKPVALTPVVSETKKEEKSTTPAVPVVTETKKEENSAAPASAAPPAALETKNEEKPVAPTPVETKPAAPVVTETKKEEKSTKPAAPVVTETKKEEISATPAPVETTPPAPVVTETKKEEKVVPVETKPAAAPDDKATTSAPTAPKEEEKEEVVTIEKAFAADQEEGSKTVEATEESITLPETDVSTEPEEVSIWGIPLLEDERSDVILLKFLRARDFKVKEAFTMLKNTVQWRKDNKIDQLVAEDLECSEFEKIVFTHGVDKHGHVVIYSSYGEFQNKEIFSDKEKLNKFLKWRIQFQEKCVRALDFSPEAKSSFVFISDFRNAPGLGKRSLWQFIKRAVKQFEDNYPEFVAKELFINVPWWYIPYYKTIGSIITSPRTRSKMVLSGPSKSADTIFKYVAPEVVPVKYGGLSKDSPFTAEDGVTEAIVKSSAKHTIELPASEGCTVSWELRVLGADVSYGAQFEPTNESSYTVIVSKNRKIGLTDEPVITDSFKASEPGKVVITIDNPTFKKKKVLYRFKTQA